MELFNRTRVAAGLFHTSLKEDQLLASLVSRTRFTLQGSELVQQDSPGEELSAQPRETDYGTFEEDGPFAREGTDVFVMGNVYPARSGEGTRGAFELLVGDQVRYRLNAVGDRVWERKDGALVASEPRRFESLPLSWERAYGGKTQTPDGDFPYHANALGRGFYKTEEEAEGSPLPNLEDPTAPVTQWNDEPVPHATAPLQRDSSLRIHAFTVLDDDTNPTRIVEVTQAYYNNAQPALVARPGVQPGMAVAVKGARPNGELLEFRVPHLDYHAHVQLADRNYVFPSHLESLTIWTEEGLVEIGHRCTFKYRFRELERRAAVLHEGPLPDEVPVNYPLDWDQLDEEARRA